VEKSPVETLAELGVRGISQLKIEVLKFSPPDEQQNARVYSRVNEVLEERIRQTGLECTHITGEMRALADPHHRKVCRKNWQAHKRRIDVVCYLPKRYRNKGRDVWRWNRRNWQHTDWHNQLDAYDLLGNGEVRLFGLTEREPIHYSVFFDRFVLLQSRHSPPSHTKRVWLLESVRLTEILREKAEKIVSRAERVSPRLFRDLCLSLSSPLALDCLFTVRESGAVNEEWLYSRLKQFAKPPYDFLGDLMAVNFIKRAEGNLIITAQGKDYLKLFTNN
jgi:hypothetical protein